MSKRQLIPAALREEFTEYSSLLRALRTSHTLDLPVHLTEPYAKNNNDENDSGNDGDERGPSTSATPAAPTGTGIETVGSKRKRSESEPKTAHWRNRDQWTRWPIPTKDVPPPDWPLLDEIGAIIKSALFPDQDSYSPSFDGGGNEHDNNENEGDDMEEELLTNLKEERPSADIDLNDIEDEQDAYVHSLAETMTPVIQNKLESLFALISAHTIARSDSMQNRIEPFDWRDLLNIMGSPAAGHLVDGTTLQAITTRMEQIFETTPASASNSVPVPLPSTVIHRHALTQDSRTRLRGLLSKHTASLFKQSLPPTDHKYLTSRQISARKKKAEKRSKKRMDIKEEGVEEERVEEERVEEERVEEVLEEGGGGQDLGVLKVKGKGKAKGDRKATEEAKGKAPMRVTSNTEQPLNEDLNEYSDWETDKNS